MNHLDLYDVLAVAARVLRVEADAVVDGTDLEALASILQTATAAATADRVAAELLAGLIRDQPFPRMNRVIAVAVVLQFAALNRSDLRLEPAAELDDVLDRVRAGRIGTTDLARILRERLCSRAIWSELEALYEWEETMFELFSESARRAIVLAQEEARDLQHNYVGTEHVLLGLLEEGDNAAATALAAMGVSAAAVRAVVVEIVGQGSSPTVGHIPFTPRAKRVFELSRQEAKQQESEEFRPEHILLGLIAEGHGVAAQALVKLGADPVLLRRRLTTDTEMRRRSESAVRGFIDDDQSDQGSLPWTPHTRRRHLIAQLRAILDENDKLREDNTRLRTKLEAHHLDPDD